MEKMSKLAAIKKYLQRDDSLAPGGGREVKTPEFQGIPQADLVALGDEAAKILGVEIG